jgi:hypothetical protein
MQPALIKNEDEQVLLNPPARRSILTFAEFLGSWSAQDKKLHHDS